MAQELKVKHQATRCTTEADWVAPAKKSFRRWMRLSAEGRQTEARTAFRQWVDICKTAPEGSTGKAEFTLFPSGKTYIVDVEEPHSIQ